MKKFAKVINLEEEEAQVLVRVDFNSSDEGKPYELSFESLLDSDVSLSAKVSVYFPDRETAMGHLNRYSKEDALKFYQEMVGTMML